MKLTFCDMAGSEKDTRDEESLSTLSLRTFHTVVSLLAAGSSAYIPYRESKLTTLLQHALHPSSYTCYIHNISPAQKSIEATIDSLNFLTKTAIVPLTPVKRVFVANQTLSEDLREEVASLRDALERFLPNGSPTHLKQATNEQESVVAEIEELLQTKHDIVQEIGSARQSPAKQEQDKFFPQKHRHVASDFIHSDIAYEGDQEQPGNGVKTADSEKGKRLELPANLSFQAQSASPQPSMNRSSAHSHRAPASANASIDTSLDQIVISSARNKDKARQKVLDSARQASSALRSRGKHSSSSSRPEVFLSPEEAAAMKERVDAEMRKLEEEKEAQRRRLGNRIQRELQEQDEFRRKLNRKPAIEPRQQRPIRAGLRNILLD
jgi:hypothetical protein